MTAQPSGHFFYIHLLWQAVYVVFNRYRGCAGIVHGIPY